MPKYSFNAEVKEIEKQIDGWGKTQKIGAENISPTTLNKTFWSDIKNIKYDNYINSGDYHYFIGRIIFTKGGGIYGFFCAQQCIENYLKAYVIFKTGKLKNLNYQHDLHKWLKYCRKISPLNSFLNTKRAELLITKFDPFNELPRYPLARRGVEGNRYSYIRPHDIFPLDYFIYKIRKEMPLPKGVWNILGEGKPYGAASLDKNDPLILVFKENNINY